MRRRMRNKRKMENCAYWFSQRDFFFFSSFFFLFPFLFSIIRHFKGFHSHTHTQASCFGSMVKMCFSFLCERCENSSERRTWWHCKPSPREYFIIWWIIWHLNVALGNILNDKCPSYKKLFIPALNIIRKFFELVNLNPSQMISVIRKFRNVTSDMFKLPNNSPSDLWCWCSRRQRNKKKEISIFSLPLSRIIE